MLAKKKGSRSPDVVVIGGGLIGCSIAFRLAQAGLKVCVLERGEPGGEASRAAAGMLAPQGETVEPGPFYDLCAASRDLYPRFVQEIEELSGQNVGYRRDGTLVVALDDAGSNELDAAFCGQTRHGLSLDRLTPEEARRRVAGLSSEIRGGLFIPGDHWVDNERLTSALALAMRQSGATFLPHHPVTAFNISSGRVESVEARAEGAARATKIFAGEFVLAAGCWSGELLNPLGVVLPAEPCRGQMMEFESSAELPFVVRAGHHYLVPRPGRRILAGTTAEYVGYDKSVTGEGLRSILEGVTRIAPWVKELRFLRAWAGLRPDTRDHLPVLGRGHLENLVYSTGHFRNGILLAPLTAQLVSELLLKGSTSHDIEAYRPTRFSTY